MLDMYAYIARSWHPIPCMCINACSVRLPVCAGYSSPNLFILEKIGCVVKYGWAKNAMYGRDVLNQTL